MARAAAAAAAACVLVGLAACELRPAPKPMSTEAAVAIEAAPVAVDAAEPPAPVAVDAEVAPADSGAPDDAEALPSADCVATAEHVATVLIESADAGARASLERSRDRLVRTMAVGCTAHGWNADKQKCFQLARLEADVHACEKMYPQPVPAASGSAR